VLIEESRPLSATKRWRLLEVVHHGGETALPGQAVVTDETEVSEAIHAAAHPGRQRDGEADGDLDAATGEAAQ
jgi:hypothetical protein